MTVPEPEASVEAAPLEIRPGPAAAFTEIGDGWLGADLAGQAARLAVAAWARAVNGDDTTLTAIAEPVMAHYLLNPVRQDWVVAPGPVVTGLEIWSFDASGDMPELDVSWQFTGRQRHAGPAAPPGWTGYSGEFAGMVTLSFTGSGPWPWRVTRGHVDTLDGHLGYTFTSRDETAAEYRARTGSGPRAGALVPSDTYQLVAGFAEHDERFGGRATAEVLSDTPPTRQEAQQLAWSAVEAQTERALGPGDWQPSLNWLDMVRLLEEAPPAEPAPVTATDEVIR
jgi:hypothetical protein